jgi:hypothetical protein
MYFGGKYAAPALFDDIKFLILAMQPLAAVFLLHFTVEDVKASIVSLDR